MKEIILIEIKKGTINRRDLLHLISQYEPITDRKMRLLIAELIEDGEPIMSSEKGYSLIRNEADLKNAIDYLKVKAKSISVRANMLLRNWNRNHQSKPINHQISLEL